MFRLRAALFVVIQEEWIGLSMLNANQSNRKTKATQLSTKQEPAQCSPKGRKATPTMNTYKKTLIECWVNDLRHKEN